MGRSCSLLSANVRGLAKNRRDLAVSASAVDVILLSETLMSDRRHDAELLLGRFRRPVHLRRGAVDGGRGMSVYVREGFNAFRQSTYECGCHELQVVRVCGRHINFYVFSVYRSPSRDDSIYDCLLNGMALAQSNDAKASFVFVGDFNAHHTEWLGSVTPTDCHGIAALDFATTSGCQQLVDRATHVGGNRLDLVFTDVPRVENVQMAAPIGSSEHSALLLTLTLQQDVPEFSRGVKYF